MQKQLVKVILTFHQKVLKIKTLKQQLLKMISKIFNIVLLVLIKVYQKCLKMKKVINQVNHWLWMKSFRNY